MSSEGKWVTLTGIIQFDPEAKTIASSGQDVFEFQFRDAGMQRRVKATLWPEHAEAFGVPEKGDGVIVDGKLKVNEATNKDGDPVTYYNLSVSELAVIKRQPKKERDAAAPAASASGGGEGGNAAEPW